MRIPAPRLCWMAFGALVLLTRAGAVEAQGPVGESAGRANATRQELERMATDAEAIASSGSAEQVRAAQRLAAARQLLFCGITQAVPERATREFDGRCYVRRVC